VSIVQRIAKPIRDIGREKWSLQLWMKFLALGVAMTVIVSWCCAIFVDISESNNYKFLGTTLPQSLCLGIFQMDDFGSQMYEAFDILDDASPWFDEQIMTNDEIDSIPAWTRYRGNIWPTPNARLPRIRTDIARGWPLLALSCTMDAVWEGDYSSDPVDIRYGIDLGHFQGSPHLSRRVLGYKPIWSGILVDSLCFGTLAAFLTFIFWTIRYHIRLSRTRCPFCNYFLHSGVPGCPECGWNRPEDEGKAGEKE